MNKRGAKGYWISTAKIINQDLFDEYVNKVGPWLKEVGGQVFAKDTEPQGKERSEDADSRYLWIPFHERCGRTL